MIKFRAQNFFNLTLILFYLSQQTVLPAWVCQDAVINVIQFINNRQTIINLIEICRIKIISILNRIQIYFI